MTGHACSNIEKFTIINIHFELRVSINLDFNKILRNIMHLSRHAYVSMLACVLWRQGVDGGESNWIGEKRACATKMRWRSLHSWVIAIAFTLDFREPRARRLYRRKRSGIIGNFHPFVKAGTRNLVLEPCVTASYFCKRATILPYKSWQNTDPFVYILLSPVEWSIK